MGFKMKALRTTLVGKPFPRIDKKGRFYKNCKRQRKIEAKICQDCPFRKGIEEQENG